MKKRYMLGIVIILFFIGIVLFVNFHPVFGAKANGLEKSSNYKNGKFVNLIETKLETGDRGYLGMIKDYIISDEVKRPKEVLPTKQFDKTMFKTGDIAWFGHSTILMNVDGINIITDPVFNTASPLFFGGNPFDYSIKPEIEDLPDLDVVLISHDHYDHLDYEAIKEIDIKVGKYFVPLGIKAHLVKWGVDSEKVTEHDWYNENTISEIKFVFTPTRHFSGRGLTNRGSTLWGSWVIKGKETSLYFSGDSGYSPEFEKIGEKYGPFDIAFIENGAYNESWSNVHMYPEESVQAGIDLKAENIMPIHWGKFDLSFHSWYDPIERFSIASEKNEISYFHPQIGELFNKENLPKTNWWKDLIVK